MATQESVAPMNTAEGNIAHESDIGEDTALILQPQSNWEQFLMPGPSSVAILGQIMFISAKEDFAIDKTVPKDGFQYIKYPKSFRASLVQVSNEGCEAFQEAHKNMDQIRLLARNIPTDLSEAMMILAQEDPKIIEDFLQIPLENVSPTVDKCCELSETVEKKFNGVIRLINELLQACTGSKGVYEQQLQEIKKEKELNETKEKDARKDIAKMEEKHQTLESDLKQAQEDYKASMDSMPVGWNAVTMGVVEKFVDAVTSLNTGKIIKSLFSRGSRKEPRSKGTKDETLENLIQMLYSFQNHDEKIDWEKLNSKKGIEILSCCKQKLREFQEAAGDGGDCPEKDVTLKFCETGIGICEELENLQKSEPVDEEAAANIALKIKQVTQDAMKATSDCKVKAGSTPPHMSHAETGDGPRGLTTACLNARFKVEQSVDQLQKQQKLNEKNFEDMKQKNEEIQRILESLKSCNVQEIDFETTVQLLKKGLDTLGFVKGQWGKMGQFFSALSNEVKNNLKPSVHKIIQYGGKSSSGYSPNQFTKKLLERNICKATECASIVQMITETYVRVSTHHLMDRISSLGKLMGLDPNRDGIKFEQEREKFDAACSKAKKAIEDLAKESKAQYEERLQARIDRLHNSVKTLPPLPYQKK